MSSAHLSSKLLFALRNDATGPGSSVDWSGPEWGRLVVASKLAVGCEWKRIRVGKTRINTERQLWIECCVVFLIWKRCHSHASVCWCLSSWTFGTMLSVCTSQPTVPWKHASVRWMMCGWWWFLESIPPSAGWCVVADGSWKACLRQTDHGWRVDDEPWTCIHHTRRSLCYQLSAMSDDEQLNIHKMKFNYTL